MSYDCSDPEGGIKLWKAAAALVFCIVVILSVCLVINDAPRDDEITEREAPRMLELDCSDAEQMHAYGLPSESDVLNWHVHGKWGYKDCNGNIQMFSQLPGETWRWDVLYGIKWRKVFQH